jgi:abortive infection bacteriophage resistance protein
MKTQNVISKFDIDAALYEAKQRCFWFINGYFQHGLTSKLFSSMSTERICEIYNVDIEYFKMKK